MLMLYNPNGWDKKPRLFSRVNNFAMVKACDMSKVSEFCLEKSAV